MVNIYSFFIASLMMVYSASSLAIPVRHYFEGDVENSSFGYEGKAVKGWYQYDFSNYDAEEPYLHNLFTYYLTVGDLEITEGESRAVTASIKYFGGSVHGFRLRGETPFNILGDSYSMDVFDLAFSDSRQTESSEGYDPTSETLDLSRMEEGEFEIYGHRNAVLPDGSTNVFWLKGDLRQTQVSYSVTEPSTLVLLTIGMALLFGLRNMNRSQIRNFCLR